MTDTTTQAHTEILAVLDARIAAHAARDVDALFALSSDAPVMYTLAPPLQQAPDSPYGTRDGVRAWFGTFAGPVQLRHLDPVVTTDGDVAFVHALTSMTATPAGASEPFTLWYRSTLGLRRIDGRWLIVHAHDSTPFHMDGSFRAAVDLQP